MTKVKRILMEKRLKTRVFNQELGIAEGQAYRFVSRQAVLPMKWRQGFADVLGVKINDIMDESGLALLDETKAA